MSNIVENTCSVARDNLANERTFLAWLRTGVTLMGVGTALIKFDAIIAGISFNFMGIVFIVSSLLRYFQVLNALKENKFVINSTGIIIVTVMCLIFIIFSSIIIVYAEFN